MVDKEDKKFLNGLVKAVVYGANVARPVLRDKLHLDIKDMGSSLGAAYFAALDILGTIPKVKDSIVYRISKPIGSAAYFASGIKKVVEAYQNGDPSSAVDGGMDLFMGGSLMKGSFKNYEPEDKNFLVDIHDSVYKPVKYFKNSFKKIKETRESS